MSRFVTFHFFPAFCAKILCMNLQDTIFFDETVYDTFARRLTYIMTIRNVSTQELAELLCVSRSAISNYRNGRRFPNLQQLCLLAVALNISTDYLLGISDTYTI